MATLSLPLAILDAEGTASSIARFTDGNATAPKSLKTLGDTEFGAGTQNIANWDGLTDVKVVKSFNFLRVGNCGSTSAGNVIYTCDCTISTPAMVVGDRFDANICWCACSSNSNAFGEVRILCNTVQIFCCRGVFLGSDGGIYTAQNIDNNDSLTYHLSACAALGSGVGTTACACFCINTLTDQQQATFTLTTPKSQFVFVQGN